MEQTQQDSLERIAVQLEQLTTEVQELNRSLQACIIQPDGQKPRFMIGAAGTLEVMTY